MLRRISTLLAVLLLLNSLTWAADSHALQDESGDRVLASLQDDACVPDHKLPCDHQCHGHAHLLALPATGLELDPAPRPRSLSGPDHPYLNLAFSPPTPPPDA
jgi:hypothetical protein